MLRIPDWLLVPAANRGARTRRRVHRTTELPNWCDATVRQFGACRVQMQPTLRDGQYNRHRVQNTYVRSLSRCAIHAAMLR